MMAFTYHKVLTPGANATRGPWKKWPSEDKVHIICSYNLYLKKMFTSQAHGESGNQYIEDIPIIIVESERAFLDYRMSVYEICYSTVSAIYSLKNSKSCQVN